MTEKAADGTTGTLLRQKMLGQMRIAGLAERTQEIYVGEIEQLAKHYNASPADLDADQLTDWVLSGIERGLNPATTNITVAALKFLYADTLGCPERVTGLRARKRPRKLPRHMTEEEVERLILATPDLRYRAAFVTAYGAGLRISETVAIKVGDIKSNEKLLHIPAGKGGTERMAPLPDEVIDYLRGFYKSIWPQPATWLFCGASPDRPMVKATLQGAFRKARVRAGLSSRYSFHCLRHSAATHLHERGGDMEVIRDALGHRRADTTREYARSTPRMFEGLDHPVSGFSVLRRMPRRMNRSVSTSMTSIEESLRRTRIARLSRVNSSRTLSIRKALPS